MKTFSEMMDEQVRSWENRIKQNERRIKEIQEDGNMAAPQDAEYARYNIAPKVAKLQESSANCRAAIKCYKENGTLLVGPSAMAVAELTNSELEQMACAQERVTFLDTKRQPSPLPAGVEKAEREAEAQNYMWDRAANPPVSSGHDISG